MVLQIPSRRIRPGARRRAEHARNGSFGVQGERHCDTVLAERPILRGRTRARPSRLAGIDPQLHDIGQGAPDPGSKPNIAARFRLDPPVSVVEDAARIRAGTGQLHHRRGIERRGQHVAGQRSSPRAVRASSISTRPAAARHKMILGFVAPMLTPPVVAPSTRRRCGADAHATPPVPR